MICIYIDGSGGVDWCAGRSSSSCIQSDSHILDLLDVLFGVRQPDSHQTRFLDFVFLALSRRKPRGLFKDRGQWRWPVDNRPEKIPLGGGGGHYYWKSCLLADDSTMKQRNCSITWTRLRHGYTHQGHWSVWFEWLKCTRVLKRTSSPINLSEERARIEIGDVENPKPLAANQSWFISAAYFINFKYL